MANENCGNCEMYWEIKRATTGGAFKDTGRGHCLAKSIYASNAPGKPIYPPKGKLEETLDRCSKVVVVQAKEIVVGCITFKPRKKSK